MPLQALSDMQFSARTLYVPDTHGVLVPASELSYDDAKWMREELKTGSRRLVHPKLSNEVSRPCHFTAPNHTTATMLMLVYRCSFKCVIQKGVQDSTGSSDTSIG